MYDIIVIGAGTAGMSAAIYGLRAGKSVLVIEAKTYGGQIINTPEIENYPGISQISGFEFATNLYNQAKKLGAEFVFEKAQKIEDKENIKIVVTNKNSYEGKAVIIATGAKNRQLGLDREEQMVGRGVSYCATCDGMFFRGRNVAVIGGGNTALEDATFLSNYCDRVYLVHRRDSFRGEEHLANVLRQRENVTFVLNCIPMEILGDEQVNGLIVKDVNTGETKKLDVSGIFVAIGQVPDNSAFDNVIALDGKGYAVAGEDCKTESKGIFVAGDCRTKQVRQLTTAASDGAVAALAACEISTDENIIKI